MLVDLEDAFNPNALYSKQHFTVDELQLFKYVMQLKKDIFSDIPKNTITLAHASANLITNINTIPNGKDWFNLIALDIEFIRLLDLYTDGIDDFVKNTDNHSEVIDQLCRRLLFHSSIKNGDGFAISQIPPAPPLQTISKGNGSIAIYISGAMQMLGHELGHLDMLLDNKSDNFIKSTLKVDSAAEILDFSHQYDLKPEFLLKVLPVKKELRGKSLRLEISNKTDDSWLSEIYCDIRGVNAAIKMHIDNNFPIRDLVLVTLSLHFTQLLICISQRLITVPNLKNGISENDINAIYSMSERAYASIGLLFHLVLPLTKEKDGKLFFKMLIAMSHRHQAFVQQLIHKIYFLLTVFNDHANPVFKSQSLRKVAEEWGYIHKRYGKVMMKEEGFNFAAK